MGFRVVRVFEVKEILRLWARGKRGRTLARAAGVDRKTARRYVTAAQALGLAPNDEKQALDDAFVGQVIDAARSAETRPIGTSREHCRAHAEVIADWVSDGVPGPKIARLLHRHTGVGVPVRTLQRFISNELPSGRSGGDAVRVVDGEPGQVLEIDFLLLGELHDRTTGRKRKLYALLCLAPYSRHMFVWPCFGQTRDDVIEGLEAAGEFFGGVCPVLLPDNMSTVVTKADPIAPLLNEVFVEYAQARSFEIDPARPRKPQDKGRVERQVPYVRGDYFGGEDFGSLEVARNEAARWCREDAGTRDHGTTHQQPLAFFEREELPLLKPAPTAPYDRAEWFDVTLGRGHAVTVRGALYSVPYTIAPTELRVRLDRAIVKFYLKETLVKVHPRQRPGGVSIDGSDFPPGKAELATRDAAAVARRASECGEHVGEYARRVLDSPLPWTRMRAAFRLLGLCQRFGNEAVDEACARALELDVVDVKRITTMLEKGLLNRRTARVPRPPAQRVDNVIQMSRFARHPSEWRTPHERPSGGAPDATQ